MTTRARFDWEQVLRRAGLAGRRAILRNYDIQSRTTVTKRGAGGDLTLKIDEASEKAIFASLIKSLGGKSEFVFFSEEMGEVSEGDSSGKPVVICDPLDGSHNAEVGIPFFSVSLSVIEPGYDEKSSRTFGGVSAAYILSVKTDDEYFALKRHGAYHNGARIKRPKTPLLRGQVGTLLIETGDIDYLREKILVHLSKRQIYKVRVLGSAALSFCMLSDGSADAMIFAQPGGARTIDSPAGYLIAREAGCFISSLSGEQSVDSIEVGFGSRVNLLGAHDEKLLSRLEGRLGQLK